MSVEVHSMSILYHFIAIWVHSLFTSMFIALTIVTLSNFDGHVTLWQLRSNDVIDKYLAVKDLTMNRSDVFLGVFLSILYFMFLWI